MLPFSFANFSFFCGKSKPLPYRDSLKIIVLGSPIVRGNSIVCRGRFMNRPYDDRVIFCRGSFTNDPRRILRETMPSCSPIVCGNSIVFSRVVEDADPYRVSLKFMVLGSSFDCNFPLFLGPSGVHNQ